MTKLLGLRTVHDIDPNKTFRIADILEAGAILPRSVLIGDLMESDLQDEPQCICLFYIGNNGPCPVHGSLDDSTAYTREMNDIYTMGNGG